MHALVVHDSKFGNTEKVAQAIARGVGRLAEVNVSSTTGAVSGTAVMSGRPDLLFLGGPTHSRGPSAALKVFLDALPSSLRGVPVACFDTRYRGPLLLMGSAAVAASKVLAKAGADIVSPAESFFIVRRGSMALQQLEPGELERAEQWGHAVAAAAFAAHPVTRAESAPA